VKIQIVWYGWCDIGYFRCRQYDMTVNQLDLWPSERRLNELNPEKIYYGRVNNDSEYMKGLMIVIQNKNEKGLPANPIPPIKFLLLEVFSYQERKRKIGGEIHMTNDCDFILKMNM
jgi:hypothetical protein